MAARSLLVVTLAAAACGAGCGTGCREDRARAGKPHGTQGSQTGAERDPRAAGEQEAPAAAPISEIPAGLAARDAFAWSQRAGHAAYGAARTAEAGEDWPAMVAAARKALAADPGHLEAAWLLATGLARLGEHTDVLAPLHTAVAGDFGRWGDLSLAHPALTEFLATPVGEAWRAHVERDRAAYLDLLGRGVIVIAGGELYAVDVDGSRWLQLTHTGGAVIGAFRPARDRLAYVVRGTALAAGTVDLARGRTSGPVALGTSGPVTLAYSTKAPVGLWTADGAPIRWRHLKEDGTLARLSTKTRAPAGPRLEIDMASLRRRALPVENVSADWDEQGLASAIRIGSSNRVVSAPGAALIDGHTIVWSPSRVHLAFVAQLDVPCTPDAITAVAYVANAATGTMTEVGRAGRGLAVDWVGERRLALAGDEGVTVLELDGGPQHALPGATDVLIPRAGRSCPAEKPSDENSDAPVVEPL